MSLASSLFTRHPRLKIGSDLLLKMEAQLFVEFTFSARFVKPTTEPVHDGTPIRQIAVPGPPHSTTVPNQEPRFQVACVLSWLARRICRRGLCRCLATPHVAIHAPQDGEAQGGASLGVQ